jgi:predicted GNAT family acetyltransferase
MHVEPFLDPAEFLAAALPLASASAPLDAFVRAWSDGVARTPPDRCFMAVAYAPAPCGFALQRDEGPVVLGACSDSAARALAERLAAEHPLLEGVSGEEAPCLAFCDRWRAVTGRTHRLRHRMRNYVLTALRVPPAVAGAMRVAASGDRDWLRAQLRAFSDEARVAMSDERIARHVDERLAENSYRIWQTEDGPRAFAGFSRAGPAASRVAPVYTIPAARRQGYAAALVGGLCAELLAQRPRVFLVSDLANATSNALYRRLGFQPLDDTVSYEFVAAR